MKHNAPQSLKFRRLCRLLRPEIDCTSVSIETIVVGMLERLWHATIVTAPTGDIGKADNIDIAEAIGWHGDADFLIDCLIQAGWLDHCAVHRLIVHDWAEHAPGFLKGNLKSRGIGFVVPQVEDRDSNQTEPDVTRPDVTQPNPTNKPSPLSPPLSDTAKHPAKRSLVCFSETDSTGTNSSDEKPGPRSEEIADVFAHYQRYHPMAKLGKKERRLIAARLNEGFSVAECCRAIDGIHRSPFHSGNNDNGRKYQSLELIFRNASKTNEFIEMTERPELELSAKNRTSIRATQRFLNNSKGTMK